MGIRALEEALGLRLMIDGNPVMLPEVYDPSELRSDVNGEVVPYLHDEGAEVAKGETYIELEARKMIMALKSTETGEITHAKSAGSIVSADELLPQLELKEPSTVQAIEPFEGTFNSLDDVAEVVDPAPEDLGALLDDYELNCRGLCKPSGSRRERPGPIADVPGLRAAVRSSRPAQTAVRRIAAGAHHRGQGRPGEGHHGDGHAAQDL